MHICIYIACMTDLSDCSTSHEDACLHIVVCILLLGRAQPQKNASFKLHLQSYTGAHIVDGHMAML